MVDTSDCERVKLVVLMIVTRGRPYNIKSLLA